MISRKIGLELARARSKAGLTQAELASLVGTTQSAIARAEAGRTTPSPVLIERIAVALGSPITIVFGSDSAGSRRQRVRAVLGEYRFDPWERDPSPAEARALEASGVKRGKRRG